MTFQRRAVIIYPLVVKSGKISTFYQEFIRTFPVESGEPSGNCANMNVTDSTKLASIAVTTAPTQTAPAATTTEATKAEPAESTVVTLSDEALKMSTMAVDDPGDWPKPPKNGN